MYLKNEALIAFISGETEVAQVRDLAGAIHDRFSRASNELSGVRDVLYGGNSSGPVDSITSRLQSEIARLITEKKREDAMSESDCEDGNGNGCEGGNGAGKSEKLEVVAGRKLTVTVTKLVRGGAKAVVPGCKGKAFFVECERTGHLRTGQSVVVSMTGRIDDWKNPVAQLVSVS